MHTLHMKKEKKTTNGNRPSACQNGSNGPDVDVRILTTNVAKGKREKKIKVDYDLNIIEEAPNGCGRYISILLFFPLC